jgi:protein-S-isoprenylcysteine O-methyltransferase Ste14
VPLPLERITSVLIASCCLILMMWLWQPIAGIIWSVTGLAGKGLLQFFFFLGWGLVFISTLLISHFDLFGLRQVWFYFNGKPYASTPVRTPMFYRFVRNPLYLGFVLAFWCTPVMTASHLLFAIICTAYILTQFRVSGLGFRVAAAIYNH